MFLIRVRDFIILNIFCLPHNLSKNFEFSCSQFLFQMNRFVGQCIVIKCCRQTGALNKKATAEYMYI